MFNQKQMESLKQGSCSKNTEKTKARVGEAFKKASKEQKDIISKTAGTSISAYYAAARTGSAAPKIILSLAQTLEISPYYLAGETDDATLQSESLKEFYETFKNKTKKANAANKAKKTSAKAPATSKTRTKMTTEPSSEPIEPKSETIEPKSETIEPKSEPQVQPTAPQSIDSEQPSKITIQLDTSNEIDEAIANLPKESALILFEALIERSKYSSSAKNLYDIIKRCLLS